MATVDELKSELNRLLEQKEETEGDKRRKLESQIATLQRRLYEAGPHHARWLRLQKRVEPRFVATVDGWKPLFEFVRMILTSSVVVAVTILVAYRAPTDTDDWFTTATWGISLAGLVLMCLLLLVGSYAVTVQIGPPVTAMLADQFQAPFSRGVLKAGNRTVIAMLLAAVLTLGFTFGTQAIKQTTPCPTPERPIPA